MSRHTVVGLAAAVLTGALVACTPTLPSTDAGHEVEVVRVVDGDTLDVATKPTAPVRVLGIDTPEIASSDQKAECQAESN